MPGSQAERRAGQARRERVCVEPESLAKASKQVVKQPRDETGARVWGPEEGKGRVWFAGVGRVWDPRRLYAGIAQGEGRIGSAGRRPEEEERVAMALKTIQRSATVAFAPMAQVMAIGTMAGAIDLSFSSSAHLELLKLDFASSDLDIPVLSSAVVPERFNRLSWSSVFPGTQEEFPLGVIAGGLADGSLHFWNPHKLLRLVGFHPRLRNRLGSPPPFRPFELYYGSKSPGRCLMRKGWCIRSASDDLSC